MNVTFLIGNGFDLACGVKTSYIDFVTRYTKETGKNENLRSFKTNIAKNLDTWADAELAFGDYSKKYSLGEIAKFRECLDDFVKEMAKHLLIQEKQAVHKELSKPTLERFKEGLLNFYDFLPEASMKILNPIFQTENSMRRNFSFLVFNYTTIFESVMHKLHSAESLYFGSSKMTTSPDAANYLNTIIYVHGKLNSSSLIFGVDNKDQIANKELLSDQKFLRSIIKPDVNSQLRNDTVQTCTDCIDKSDIICIYGMSLGLTDSVWWKRIFDWLQQDTNHHLIYYAWSSDCVRDSVGSYIDTLEDCRASIYKKFTLSTEDETLLRDQIHIEVNVDLFGVGEHIAPYIRSN